MSQMSDNSSDVANDRQYFVPTHGTYIVVQLAPINMVQPLGDPDLTAAAQILQPKKYIAYVFQTLDLPLPRRPDHKCRIALVGRGLCRQDDEECIDAAMCVPILPATEHPLSRTPVPTTPPFRFPGCYQHSIAMPVVRIQTKLFYDHTNATFIPPYDRFPVKLYLNEDHQIRDARLAARVQADAQLLPSDDAPKTHLQSVHAASISLARESDRTGLLAAPVDTIPAGTAQTQTGTDALDGEPRTSNGKADARHDDNSADTSRPEPAALQFTTSDSKTGLADEASCLAAHVHQSKADEAALPPDTPAGVDTAELAHRNAESVGRQSLSDSQQHGQDVGDDDGRSDSYVPSMIESIADRPRSASPAPSDLLPRVFLGDPEEDRDIIPLVTISLDLLEVGEVNDPMAFLKEIKEIERLVLEHRSRHPRAEWNHCESTHAASIDMSWVDVTLDAPSILEQRDTTSRKRRTLPDLCDAAKFKLRTRFVSNILLTWSSVL
ncbi:uncharacterized protein C8Q71DRAFT_774528 [Rhodofomes roseus]|uniref:Arrestin C-terminal-like domain-containing protein n=1 Tax=Rhodofomes roseus TaxID=34475 RepID=A0ABQ8K7G5_9APHY|nr:uncharacterized protein C8Q71DRAFT_774528 [Rhodofomes roseus]KAH9833188.1 hypothetical protein C8Q71DRAFT_774528 [Rhodofomes roseus]